MNPEKLREMIEAKRDEAKKKAEERIAKIKETAEAKIKKEEEKAAAIEVDEEKLAEAIELQEQIKGLQERLKGLGLKARASGGTRGPRPKSVSGKYATIRALVEELFDADKSITAEDMETEIKVEFPDSVFSKTHYSWYKNQLFNEGNWKTIKK